MIKVEDPRTGGDIGRYIPPSQIDANSLYFETFNRGKRSLSLDLKAPKGRAVFERLVATSHAVFNNLRGDLVEELGLTYETLGPLNPGIVCASLSGYGRVGDRKHHPGYDALIQAEAGWAALTGEPGGPPMKSGLSLVDYSAGLVAALALMAALFDAQRTGCGRDVDTSLYDVALGMLTYPATWYLTSGIVTERQPMSAHPSVVPFQFFATADGYIAVACAKEKFFRSLAEAIGLPELANDVRFVSFEGRRQNRAALLAVLAPRFREQTTETWMERLRGHVPCAPVRSLVEALARDELLQRNMLAAYQHPVFGEVVAVGTPFSVSDFQPQYRAAPGLGADTPAILAELGYSAESIAELVMEGAIRGDRPGPVTEDRDESDFTRGFDKSG